jgi:hypothetical protein
LPESVKWLQGGIMSSVETTMEWYGLEKGILSQTELDGSEVGEAIRNEFNIPAV